CARVGTYDSGYYTFDYW
nr:immunoglobulin heavy chain junction region [Macaca mulatta]MOX61513.1 immunoglobulin heavy chain junction region [Macaca mulatta]MOX62184.1 immunoglobulin heavy chain junction region [Macaca mulatta]MOX62680.1 immunoglobulin heavy chain junction region [Macaca mulatta]MOX62722.1 immunoglobulin heavy chain junction region [Macaca mulatta]